jgi:hypothetical protein
MVAGVAGPQRPFDVEELRTNGMIRLDIAFHGRLGTPVRTKSGKEGRVVDKE